MLNRNIPAAGETGLSPILPTGSNMVSTALIWNVAPLIKLLVLTPTCVPLTTNVFAAVPLITVRLVFKPLLIVVTPVPFGLIFNPWLVMLLVIVKLFIVTLPILASVVTLRSLPTARPPVITTAPLVGPVLSVASVNVVRPLDVRVVNAPLDAVTLPITVACMPATACRVVPTTALALTVNAFTVALPEPLTVVNCAVVPLTAPLLTNALTVAVPVAPTVVKLPVLAVTLPIGVACTPATACSVVPTTALPLTVNAATVALPTTDNVVPTVAALTSSKLPDFIVP